MDRIELGTQSLKEYRSFADSETEVQGTENTGVLRDKLNSTNVNDTLIVTSIQKMSNVKAGERGVNPGVAGSAGCTTYRFYCGRMPSFHIRRHVAEYPSLFPKRAVLRIYRYANSGRKPEEEFHHCHGIRPLLAPVQHRRRHS